MCIPQTVFSYLKVEPLIAFHFHSYVILSYILTVCGAGEKFTPIAQYLHFDAPSEITLLSFGGETKLYITILFYF